MVNKYDAGAYGLVYFNRIGSRMGKRSSVYKSYTEARSAGDKWLLKHPDRSYAFHQVVYNSKTSAKWDLK